MHHHLTSFKWLGQVSLNLGGYPLTIADTAGLRHSEDAIEQEGVALAKQRLDVHFLWGYYY